MITRHEAEKLAEAIHVIRPDWPASSLSTLIAGRMTEWPLADAGAALAWVALDRAADGWVSRTPARVLEAGPWHPATGMDAQAAERARIDAEVAARHAAIAARNQAIVNCRICDDAGRLPAGGICPHTPITSPSMGAAAARAAIRPTVTYGPPSEPDSEQAAA